MKEPSDQAFVEAWIEAVKKKTGLKVLAETIGMDYRELNIRANHLRKAGVGLPRMPHPDQKRDRETVHAKALNDLIVKELGKEYLTYHASRAIRY